MSGDRGRRDQIVSLARALIARGQVPSPEALALAAGVSRSTYFRVVGSHRAVLREAGHVGPESIEARILEAAASLLNEVGISRLEMEQVAERAGVARATLYRHFPAKSELMASLARTRSPLRPLSALLAQFADRNPAEVLPGLMEAAVPRLLASRGLLRAVLSEAAVEGPDGDAPRGVVMETFAGLAAYFEAQMAAGRLRRVEPMAAVQALLCPVLIFALARPDVWQGAADRDAAAAATVRELARIWLRGMQP